VSQGRCAYNRSHRMHIDTPTLAWALLAIAAAVAEILIPHFGVIFISAGAAAGALVALLGGGLAWEMLSFAVVVAVSLALLRPRLVGWLGRAPGVPSRTDALIGKQGQVTEGINPTLGTGRVNVAGEDWAARSTSVVAAGMPVRVVGADGIVLEVLPL
jgi:membrane protein implicated in regulation of membrane protease activity